MSTSGPDLVVLDVNLPDINGIEVCKRIKADESTSHIPVLQVSATLVDTRHRVAGLEGGADAYLVQPIDPDELVATIRSLLRIRRAEEEARRRAQEIETIYNSAPVGLAMLDVGSALYQGEPATRRHQWALCAPSTSDSQCSS